MAPVDSIEEAVQRVSSTLAGSVVRIGRGPGRGGGVVVAEGAVLTNAHNLRGSQTTVTFTDGRVEQGRVAGADVDGDLAVVLVPTAGATPAEWRSEAPPVGSALFALTAPAGGGLRVTVGRVSAAGRAFRGPRGHLITGGLEHTAPLPHGSSGSPVVDSAGMLVGVSTHRLGEGFYLAVPAEADLRTRVGALARGESPRRRYLGVALLPAPAARRLRAAVGLPERDGLLVRALEDDGPAARAGVRAGDLLVSAGGQALASHDDLLRVLAGLADGDDLGLGVVRGADQLEILVSFAETGEGQATA
jgi:serine protease Do